MTPRQFVSLALGGTVALAGWGAAGFGTFNASHVGTTAVPRVERKPAPAEPPITAAMYVGQAAEDDWNAVGGTISAAASSAAGIPATEPAMADAGPKPPADTIMRLATASPLDPADDGPKPPAPAIEPAQLCVTDTCIDAYLWSLYERTPKIDTIKVPKQNKVTVKKNGKTRTVTRTEMTYATDDFTWKDPAAAQRSGISLIDYVIGGIDHDFKLRLYRALRAMDDAGLMPGITSGFRDDYRQAIAAGLKASADSSYHGGSRRGGYRHGLAVDLVSVRGETRSERSVSSEELWKWIDAHEKEFGIGRPYRDRDPPHVGPIDGLEYIAKRGAADAKKRVVQAKKVEKPATTRQLVARTGSGAVKH